MVNQQSNGSSQYEFVKCVIVGDSGVGKTCLVCAWACDSQYDLQKLVKTHVSTVWAIDHYSRDREILDRSWCDVDGVKVSLRLWDTFGYHDKEKVFAYRGADVILLCYSTVNPTSLKNIRKVWYPQIRLFCPVTPIVLVGTQTDLRFLYKDEKYIKMNKGLLYRTIQEHDIITPEQGREVAKEIGSSYYECSVLTRFGVQDVFVNAIRAAMVERRHIKFWSPQLHRIQRPLIQPPMKLPKPEMPKVEVTPPTIHEDMRRLLKDSSFGDVTFISSGTSIHAHKICLLVSSHVFEDLFHAEKVENTNLSNLSHSEPQEAPVTSTHKESLTSRLSFRRRRGDKRTLIKEDFTDINSISCTAASQVTNSTSPLETGTENSVPNHPAFESLEYKIVSDGCSERRTRQTSVVLNSDIKPLAFEYILHFLYTGETEEIRTSVEDILRAVEILEFDDLKAIVSNNLSGDTHLNIGLLNTFKMSRIEKLRELALDKKYLTDIIFKVDDGFIAGHKPLLMERCEMMQAMFSSNFLESSADVISFPGTTVEVFQALQEYLYTGEMPNLRGVDCIGVIEVANRLCLPRLINLTEAFMVTELSSTGNRGEDILEEVLQILEPAKEYLYTGEMPNLRGVDCIGVIEVANRLCLPRLMNLTEAFMVNELSSAGNKGEDILEEVLQILEPVKLYNAEQLASWCLQYLSIHHREIFQRYTKLFKILLPESQAFIEQNRWPPAWYVKELDYYEKLSNLSRKSHEQTQMRFTTWQRCRSSCFCFCGSRRQTYLEDTDTANI